MGRRAAALCLLWLLLSGHALAQGLGVPDGGAGEHNTRARPAQPPPEAAAPTPEPGVELPPSLAAPELDMRPPPAIGPTGTLPDELKADKVSYEPDGSVVLESVTLTVQSLVQNGGPLVVSAGYGRVSTETQQVELSGGVSLEVQDVPYGIPLSLDAQAASWDGKAKHLSLTGLAVPVALRDLLGDNFPAPDIEARFAQHVRIYSPGFVYLNAASVELDASDPKNQALVLHDVQAWPAPRPSADLWVTAHEVRLTGKKQINVDNAAVWIEGVKVVTWPGYSHGAKGKGGGSGSGGILSLDVPRGSIDGDSVEAREDIDVNLDPIHVETRTAYAPQYDVISHAFAYADVWRGGKLGVQEGDVVQNDFTRRAYLRSDSQVLTARQESAWGPWHLDLQGESGDVSAREVFPTKLGDLASTHRNAATADLELTHTALGGNWYFTTGATAARFDYGGGDRYEYAGARAGLIYRGQDFNNFVLYRTNDTSGTPVMPFDVVRRRELDVQARASLIPRVSNIVRAVYDFDLKGYDRLEVGTLLERRGYQFGFYWDFARERAGLELGLLTN